jgi:uncharacterized membrane protein YkoI
MRTRTMASLMLATVFTLAGCSSAKEPAEGTKETVAPSTVTATAPDSAELAEQAALAKEAKITEAAARATALKEVPGATFDKVELEKENGKLIYSYDLKVAGKEGIEEVAIDAITGKMVSRAHESPEDEKKEAAAEADEETPAGQAALTKEAKITEAAARATALKAVPGGAFSKVELEKEDSLLVYSYDITIAGKDGVEEVKVDAKTGKMVSKEHESAADEAKEKAEDAKKAAAKAPVTKKGG